MSEISNKTQEAQELINILHRAQEMYIEPELKEYRESLNEATDARSKKRYQRNIEEFASFSKIIAEVEKALARRYDRLEVKRPKSLKILADFRTGYQPCSKENAKLNEEYEDRLRADEVKNDKEVDEGIKEIIGNIRKTKYYIMREKDLKRGILDFTGDDNRIVDQYLSVEDFTGLSTRRYTPTFEELFKQLRTLVEHFEYCWEDTSFKDDYRVFEETEYNGNVADFLTKFEEIKKAIDAHVKAFEACREHAGVQERIKFDALCKHAEERYKDLTGAKHRETYARILNKYRQLHAIEHAIKVLSENQGVYGPTIAFLEAKKSECYKELDRLGAKQLKGVLEAFEVLPSRMEAAYKDAKEIADKVEESRRELEEQRAREEREHEEVLGRISKESNRKAMANRRAMIRNLMYDLRPGVLEELARDRELTKPGRMIDPFTERYEANQAYNIAYERKMREALRRHGINDLEGEPIIPPHDDDYTSHDQISF